MVDITINNITRKLAPVGSDDHITNVPTNYPTESPTYYYNDYNYYYDDDNDYNYNYNYYYTSPSEQPTTEPTLAPSIITSLPTGSPTNSPSEQPTTEPTTLAPSFATSLPTGSPTNSPSEQPTTEPTLTPSIATSLPTGSPTSSPSEQPTTEPTLAPSEAPIFSSIIPSILPFAPPTLRPSYKRPARLRYQPTIEPTVQVEPTLKPTRPKKIVKTKKRIERIYKTHEYFLRNSEAGEQIRSFMEIDSPNIDEINDLRGALNEYKNTLGKDKVWLFLNIDHILQIAENYYLNQQLGSSELNKQFSDNNQGLNHVVSVSGALGAGNITNIINYDNKDITGIIGNKKLAGITLVNVTSASKAGSISAYFTSFATALSNALGKSYLNQNKLITIKECDAYNNLGDIIYSNINTTSITSSINGFLACSNWVANHNEYILTNRGADDCVTMIGDTAALAKCCSFLGLYGLDEEL